MPFIADFAEWAAALQLDDIPEQTVAGARLQVANMLAASFEGVGTTREVIDGYLRHHSDGPCTTVTGERSDLPTACFVNAMASMVHDFDDYLFMAHSGHSAVFASLAAAEAVDAHGRDLLRAVVIANELEGRLGASVVVGPHNGQMWAFIHAAGAAAAGAALMDGSADAIGHAIALSLSAPPYPLAAGFMGGDAKNLTAAAPAATGLRAAVLAESGARTSLDVVEADGGLLDSFAFVRLPQMLRGMGRAWVTDSLSYKPFPGCAYIQSPLQLLHDILREHDVAADDVEKIRVEGSLLTWVMESMSEAHRKPGELNHVNVTFSVPSSLALTLHHGAFRPDMLGDESLHNVRDDVASLAERIELSHDWDRTISVVEGLSAGVDFRPLFEEIGTPALLRGLARMRSTHSHARAGRELLRLASPRRLREVLSLFDSDLEWEEFDYGEAQFDRLRFDFGASLELTTRSGETFGGETPRHRGAAGHPTEDTAAMVWEKLERAGSDVLRRCVVELTEAPVATLGDAVADTARNLRTDPAPR